MSRKVNPSGWGMHRHGFLRRTSGFSTVVAASGWLFVWDMAMSYARKLWIASRRGLG